MLVISRKLNQRIRIGPDVWLTVVDTNRGRVRIGIEAPADVTISKEENLPPEQRKDGDAQPAAE